MKVAFRADAGLVIGSGHVMRCLTLADELTANGSTCSFVCREHPGNMIEHIISRGYRVDALPLSEATVMQGNYSDWIGDDWSRDAQATRQALHRNEADLLVIDHYGLGERWERATLSASRIVVVDDLASRTHECALLLDQTLGRTAEDYAKLVPASATLLCGSRYALLRPQFAQTRASSIFRRAGRPLTRILVSMGGMDQSNVTGAILEILNAIDFDVGISIDIVAGAQSPWVNEWHEQAGKSRHSVRVQVGLADMAGLLAETDLAIGAAGSSSWERCCLGVPTIMTTLADNQTTISRALEQSGAATSIGSPQDPLFRVRLEDAIHSLYGSPGKLERMSRAAAQLVDGAGAQRVAFSLRETFG